MTADLIDYIEYTGNIRADGLTMSLYSFIMVTGTSVCNAMGRADDAADSGKKLPEEQKTIRQRKSEG